MSGLESAASAITLIDLIGKLVKIVRRVKDAPKELSDYIDELEMLYSINGAIQQATTGIEGFKYFLVAYRDKKQGLLEFCSEHLAKVVSEASETLLKKYGQEDVSWFKKWLRRGRLSLGQELIQGLMQSVEHAKSMLQTAFSAVLIFRDKFTLQRLQIDIQEMSQKSLQNHQDVETDMKGAFQEHTQRLEYYFILQKEELQQSLQQYRNELGNHSNNLQQSFATNHAISLQLEREESKVLKWLTTNLPRSDSTSSSGKNSEKHRQNPTSRLSQSNATDCTIDENIPVIGNTSVRQSTSEAMCRNCMAGWKTKNPDQVVDSAASANGYNLNSSDEAFANLISESYFNLSDRTCHSDIVADTFECAEAYKRDEASESEDTSASLRSPVLGIPTILSIGNIVLDEACIIEHTQRYRFCVGNISRDISEDLDGTSEEGPVLHLQDPCLLVDSCQHITIELPQEELESCASRFPYARLYCREGTEGSIIEETTRKCCSHTTYNVYANGSKSIRCILENRRLAGHLLSESNTSSSVSDISET